MQNHLQCFRMPLRQCAFCHLTLCLHNLFGTTQSCVNHLTSAQHKVIIATLCLLQQAHWNKLLSGLQLSFCGGILLRAFQRPSACLSCSKTYFSELLV